MTQSVGFQDRYEETIRVKDGAGITQTVAFNDYVSEASAEIVVAANQPMPEVSEMIVETTTGKKWLVTDRGRTMTNTDIWRASYTLMRGEGTLFA